MAYLEGICMVEADTHVVLDQFNTEGRKGPALCSRGRTTIGGRLGRDSWQVATTHVQSSVLISMLRGKPKTTPSGDDLAELNYHHKVEPYSIPTSFLKLRYPRTELNVYYGTYAIV